MDEDEDEDEETADESYEGEEIGDTVPDLGREYTLEEKEAEAAEIGYKVLGPLRKSDRVFKKYEPAFAVVQVIFCDFYLCVYFVNVFGKKTFFNLLARLILDWVAPV